MLGVGRALGEEVSCRELWAVCVPRGVRPTPEGGCPKELVHRLGSVRVIADRCHFTTPCPSTRTPIQAISNSLWALSQLVASCPGTMPPVPSNVVSRAVFR